uniref:Centrosomal protein of 70 kDa n=1 Tax=Anguilla anguilla TaxID=7936 RepID=A0A0E9WBP5_ANGAN
MNEVYSKLGEMTNAMRNLRDILQLDDRAPPSEVVNQVANQVAKVSSSTSLTISQELQSLLGTRDIDSIILKTGGARGVLSCFPHVGPGPAAESRCPALG